MGPRLVRGRGPRSAGAALTRRPWWFGPDVLPAAAADAPFDLVLLDRDGTLNVRIEDGYVTRPDELVLLPGAARAVADLSGVGAPGAGIAPLGRVPSAHVDQAGQRGGERDAERRRRSGQR